MTGNLYHALLTDSRNGLAPEAIMAELYPGAFGIVLDPTGWKTTDLLERAGFVIHQTIFIAMPNRRLHFAVMFQKPYAGRPLDNMLTTGAGALWIDGARIRMSPHDAETINSKHGVMNMDHYTRPPGVSLQMSVRPMRYMTAAQAHPGGRWPANYILVHAKGCARVGQVDDAYTINRWRDEVKPFGGGKGHAYTGWTQTAKISQWRCVPGCPALELNRRVGERPSTETFSKSKDYASQADTPGIMFPSMNSRQGTLYSDAGGPSRFYHNAGWTGRDEEIGSYPVELWHHLARLLLPPARYAPRRLRTFGGRAQRGGRNLRLIELGAALAGWECELQLPEQVQSWGVGASLSQADQSPPAASAPDSSMGEALSDADHAPGGQLSFLDQ